MRVNIEQSRKVSDHPKILALNTNKKINKNV